MNHSNKNSNSDCCAVLAIVVVVKSISLHFILNTVALCEESIHFVALQ